MALLDCHFKGGRAETAPQTRTGISDKKTISQADAHLHSIDTRCSSDPAAGEGPSSGEGSDPSIVKRTQTRGEGASSREVPDPAKIVCEKYSPWMPHNHLSPVQLEQQYPSLEAVEDLDIPDLSRLEDEQLYVAGMKVVHEIF